MKEAAASRLRIPSIRATSSIEAPEASALAPRQATREFGRTSGSLPRPARSRVTRMASYALALALVRFLRFEDKTGASGPSRLNSDRRLST